MYRAPSPYGQDNRKPAVQSYPSQQAYQVPTPPVTSQIVPGSITYTTSIGADGRTIYHPFKAVSASYQTASGIVSGIQWIPAEATPVAPPGAQPAPSDFAASWNRNYLGKDDKALKEWQKEEDRRRRKEEKESSRRLHGHQERDPESELQKARELDAIARGRRKSVSGGAAPVVPFPQGAAPNAYAATGGYSPNPNYVDPLTGAPQYGPNPSAYGRENKYGNAGGYPDLSRQMGDLGLDSDEDDNDRERNRRRNKGARSQSRGRGYSASQGNGDRPSTYVAATYAPSASPYSSPYISSTVSTTGYPSAGKYNPSPNMRPGELPFAPQGTNTVAYAGSAYSPSSGRKVNDPRSFSTYGSSGTPMYPPGHIMEGQPIVQTPRSRAPSRAGSRAPSRAASRAPSPLPLGGPVYGASSTGFPQASPRLSPRPPPSPRLGGFSPGMPDAVVISGGQQQLTMPEGFSRQVNPAAPFPRFESTKIQDMDDFLDEPPPRMPQVLKVHDVYSEDWLRLMNDLKLAWNGQLPVPMSPTGQPPRRTTVVADMLDLWNTSFFLNRGVEVVLYKGKERRSGPKAGTFDRNLPDEEDSDLELSETDPEDEDESELEDYLARSQNLYGRSPEFDPALLARRRREAREERRRARKEKRARRKAREMEKKYALYITYVPVKGGHQHVVGGMQMPGAMPGAMPGGYQPSTGFVPPAVGYAGSSHRERY